MAATDIRPVGVEVEFKDVPLDPPFVIAGRPMTHLTAALVRMRAETQQGTSTGMGATILSVPWSWPTTDLDLETRDAVLRALVQRLGDEVVNGASGDPFQLWRPVYERLDDITAEVAGAAKVRHVPRLATTLALGAVDSALHDMWSRAAGEEIYRMYTSEYLNEDLRWAHPDLAGVYPGDHLGPRRTTITVQHALGVGDPLTDDEAAPGVRSLSWWMKHDGVRHLKVKLQGEVHADARRLADIYDVGTDHHEDISLSIDPNEAYREPAQLVAMLEEFERLRPQGPAAITYLEQPFPRGQEADARELRALSARVPVLIDEGYTHLAQLARLGEQGWSGVVIKSAKGHGHAMVTNAVARHLGLKIAVQDLTTVGPALAHSISLASALEPDWPHLEYNSRQYAAAANDDLAAQAPDLVQVRDGMVRIKSAASGLYQG